MLSHLVVGEVLVVEGPNGGVEAICSVLHDVVVAVLRRLVEVQRIGAYRAVG